MTQYRGYSIDYDPPPIGSRSCDWQFSADGYDGAPDSKDIRCGTAPSEQDAMDQIDEIIEEDTEFSCIYNFKLPSTITTMTTTPFQPLITDSFTDAYLHYQANGSSKPAFCVDNAENPKTFIVAATRSAAAKAYFDHVTKSVTKVGRDEMVNLVAREFFKIAKMKTE